MYPHNPTQFIFVPSVFHLCPGQPRSQSLSSLPPLLLTTKEAEKRDPGNEVVPKIASDEMHSSCYKRHGVSLEVFASTMY